MTHDMMFGGCEQVGGHQYALNLYTLAESVQAMTVLEVGAGWGWSGRAFAHSLSKRTGRLISIDPKPDRIIEDNRKTIIGLEMTWDIYPKKSEDVPIKGPIDLLYIDGDPNEAENDVHRYYECVRPGGLVVIDGVGGQPGPTEFVERADNYGSIPYGNTYAHAVHRKPFPIVHQAKYEAKCSDCAAYIVTDGWSALEREVDSHVSKMWHTVDALVGPRRLKYRKGPR